MLWNSAHIHIAINHLPIFGIPIFGVLLAYGIFRSQRDLQKVACVGFSIIATLSIAVFLSGLLAQEIIAAQIPSSTDWIQSHKVWATASFVSMVLLGIWSAVVAMGLRTRDHRRLLYLTLFFSLIVTGLLMWTAEMGGAIHHPEILRNPPAGR